MITDVKIEFVLTSLLKPCLSPPNFVRSGPTSNHFAAAAVDTVRNPIAPKFRKDFRDMTVRLEHENSA